MPQIRMTHRFVLSEIVSAMKTAKRPRAPEMKAAIAALIMTSLSALPRSDP